MTLYSLHIGDRVPLTVYDFCCASHVYSRLRDESGEGASTWPEGHLLESSGATVARVSYNGKVWTDTDWRPGDVPLFDPYAGA